MVEIPQAKRDQIRLALTFLADMGDGLQDEFLRHGSLHTVGEGQFIT